MAQTAPGQPSAGSVTARRILSLKQTSVNRAELGLLDIPGRPPRTQRYPIISEHLRSYRNAPLAREP
jgi:hypothetical protein